MEVMEFQHYSASSVSWADVSTIDAQTFSSHSFSILTFGIPGFPLSFGFPVIPAATLQIVQSPTFHLSGIVDVMHVTEMQSFYCQPRHLSPACLDCF